LPRISGQCVIALLLGTRDGIHEVGWRQRDSGAAATEADARQVADALTRLAQKKGYGLLFEPTVVLGGEATESAGMESVAVGEEAELTWRSRSLSTSIDASGALEAARELLESSVVKLAQGLDEVFHLSEAQCAEVEQMAHKFDATGGLGEALSAVEGEVSSVRQQLRTSIAGHLKEVESAAASANDIVKLASAVGQIAQSASVLTFNAKLESAHLGEAGKGFVVIAGAIRDLANDVRTSNELVTNLANSLVTTLPKLRRETAALGSTTEAQLDVVRARLASLRGSFQTAHADALEEMSKAETTAGTVRSRSHEVIQQLQFQDRTNQLLMRVKEYVSDVESVLGRSGAEEADVIARVGELGRKLDDRSITLAPGEVALF
jgi:methyl-accepting chemotaxis protein